MSETSVYSIVIALPSLLKHYAFIQQTLRSHHTYHVLIAALEFVFILNP